MTFDELICFNIFVWYCKCGCIDSATSKPIVVETIAVSGLLLLALNLLGVC